jgi:hypothetical protein
VHLGAPGAQLEDLGHIEDGARIARLLIWRAIFQRHRRLDAELKFMREINACSCPDEREGEEIAIAVDIPGDGTVDEAIELITPEVIVLQDLVARRRARFTPT